MFVPSRFSSLAPTSSRLFLNIARRRGITNDISPSPSTTMTMPFLRRAVSTSPPALAQITVNVPSMGDSITEGTIVEWCVPPGSRVREGDVLALVETDKVTVDIKADRDGILVRQLGEVEGVVEVGQGLYVMETDAAVGSNVDVSAVDASLDAGETETAVAAAATTIATSSTSPPARGKSIKFLGKEGWKARMTITADDLHPSSHPAQAATVVTPAATTRIPTSGRPNAPTSITHIPYSPMLGRPAITDEEMMALMLGGADEAPEVIRAGSGGGAVFAGGRVVTAGPRGLWLGA
ncbi:hypothetical protein ACHAW5_003860 [Stephanodiscus triporus]|uniref:Lipoamide acyltransferase component of branched-chain alpha-keto acid dehydrogenase complex, mitochondrial n=1 Tax=Stephanodiscus triporus TaxID=2934178 RepID=A0ABD3P4K0_9STRA